MELHTQLSNQCQLDVSLMSPRISGLATLVLPLAVQHSHIDHMSVKPWKLQFHVGEASSFSSDTIVGWCHHSSFNTLNLLYKQKAQINKAFIYCKRVKDQ